MKSSALLIELEILKPSPTNPASASPLEIIKGIQKYLKTMKEANALKSYSIHTAIINDHDDPAQSPTIEIMSLERGDYH